ncbi:F-box protein [Trifolium pratense]|uniref:F-box protein n=1 Tax=Trifolium pratense TaxID=57577 RepID=A0A2K3MG91_TRIPR|nr:F-box protein [Trifolium pratense]
MADLTTNEKKVSSSSYIPDEIALCILSKLPVKSLKRFSCARKSWSVLFENSDFLNKFRNNLVSKSVPLYDDACFLFKRTMYGTSFSLGLGKDEIVLDLNLPSIFLDNVLWNPNTRKMKLVPPTPVKKYLPDGLESAYCLHGFGYDCVQDDFKIILYKRFGGVLEWNVSLVGVKR